MSQPVTVEITGDGNLRMDADTARKFFPNDAMVAVLRPAGPGGHELWLMPLIGPEGGGLLLKQRNLAGDRSALVAESLPPGAPEGVRPARWDQANGALRVDLGQTALSEGLDTVTSNGGMEKLGDG